MQQMHIGVAMVLGIGMGATACGVDDPTSVGEEASANAPADTTPLSSASWTRYPGAHWCVSTGFDSHSPPYQGVVCVDLDYQTVTGGRKYNVAVELKCGTNAGTERCISAMAVVQSHVIGVRDDIQTARCVPGDHPCNRDVTVFPHPDTFMLSTNTCHTFYATADAEKGEGGFTLPDGIQKFTNIFFFTPHIDICGH